MTEDTQLQHSVLGTLVLPVAQCLRVKGFDPIDVLAEVDIDAAATMTWSCVHGLAVLALTVLALFLFTRDRIPLESSSLAILIVLTAGFSLFPYVKDGEVAVGPRCEECGPALGLAAGRSTGGGRCGPVCLARVRRGPAELLDHLVDA